MQVQGYTLPQVQIIRRIAGSQLGLQPLPNRGFEYTRQLSASGDSWEIQGLADRTLVEQLFGLAAGGVAWVTDPDRGNFHAIVEAEASWVAGDSRVLIEP